MSDVPIYIDDNKMNSGTLTNLLETTLRPPWDGKRGKARVLKVNGFNNFSFSPSSLLEVIKATSQDLSKNQKNKTL